MNLVTEIINDADRCVLCGMCLPHCPTYGLTQNEAESPRGRIALMLAVARGLLEPTPQLLGHLDRCLGCRACEAMCPSQVAYGRLLWHTRELVQKAAPPARLPHLLAQTLSSAERRRLLRRGLRLFQASGMKRAGEALHLFGNGDIARLVRSLPAIPPSSPLPDFLPAHGNERGRVALFTGCTGDLFERALLHDAARLLSLLGYAVVIPPAQACCGALHLQQGDGAQARTLAAQNLAAFGSGEPILTVASGCGALLHEYGDLLATETGQAFAARVQDINAFLAAVEWPSELKLQPLPTRVLVHESCSLRNVLRTPQALYRLLQRIPQLAVEPLAHNEQCCGAAGSYFLSEGETANRLRAAKVEAAAASGATLLVSANIGCAMHLADGMREAGLAIEVIHPVTLLAHQLA